MRVVNSLLLLLVGIWLVVELFMGDITFSANWNMFKSPLGSVCIFVGFVF